MIYVKIFNTKRGRPTRLVYRTFEENGTPDYWCAVFWETRSLQLLKLDLLYNPTTRKFRTKPCRPVLSMKWLRAS